MLLSKFRQLSDLSMGNTMHIEAYQQFLLSADMPSFLEEDILGLEAEQLTKDEAQEVLIIIIIETVNKEYTVESQLSELITFQLIDIWIINSPLYIIYSCNSIAYIYISLSTVVLNSRDW